METIKIILLVMMVVCTISLVQATLNCQPNSTTSGSLMDQNSQILTSMNNEHIFFIKVISIYSKSLIIGTSINVIFGIWGLIKSSKQIDYRDFLLSKSLQNCDHNNQGLGFFIDYQEFFLDLVIPIIKDLL